MTEGNTVSKARQLVDSVLTGPNTVDSIVSKSGHRYRIRDGYRTQRSQIEKKLANVKQIYSGVAFCLHKRLADESGQELFKDMPLKQFEAELDYTKAVELRALIRDLDSGKGAKESEEEIPFVDDHEIREHLLTGPNTLYTVTDRDGEDWLIRSGSLHERNLCEQKLLFNTDTVFDGIKFLLWKRLALEDGSPLCEEPGREISLKTLANKFTNNKAVELNRLIRELDNGELFASDDDDNELDDDDYEDEAERLAAGINKAGGFDEKVADMGKS